MVIFLKNNSIWIEGITSNSYSKLDKDKFVDVLIIGGGMTGISTAYHLRNSSLKVCLVDRNEIGMGISSKTTGKLTYLQDLMYSKISKKHSDGVAKTYLNAQIDAIKLVKDIVNDNNIDCNFTKQKSYLFANSEIEVNKLKHEEALLKYMNVLVKEENIPLNIDNKYSISVSDTYYFHPVKYIKSLANICFNNKIEINENTNIKNITRDKDKYICFANDYKIYAKKVVLACHYPFFIIPFFFPIKGYLERSYISASLVGENKNISGINISSNNSKSFRYYQNKDNYFIYLNGSHNLRSKYNLKNNFNNLIKELNKMNIKPSYLWSNIDIITNDYLPYIGRLEDNLLIGTGYNTWGMTNSSIAGKILSDIILNKENKYIKLFDPYRKGINICSVGNDIYSSLKPFTLNKLIKNKSFYKDKVFFTKRDGKNVAIYIDKNNKEHIVYNKCPHLKCSLIFNEVEKTWDCPCHASRFDIDGNVIEGPSCYNISYKNN